MATIEITQDGATYLVRILSDEGIELVAFAQSHEELKSLAFYILGRIGELV